MIQSIEIEEFRCFKHATFEGFKQVNLIGGQNNSGKTSLLESICLAFTQNLQTSNFFGTERVLNRNELVYGSPDEGTINFQIKFKKPGGEIETSQTSLVIKKFETSYRQINEFTQLPAIISSKTRLESKQLAEKLDIATRNGKESDWLKGIRCIDDSIEIIRTFTIAGSHRIYVKKKNEDKYHNLSQMGDAVSKMLEVLAHTTQNKNGYLLIDEIENGIHYSHHESFWEMLFKLCAEFNVQVFATSHSLEMIKAFNKVALEKGFADNSQYLEMFRSARSGEIVANTLAHDTLAYSIANQLSFRGEER